MSFIVFCYTSDLPSSLPAHLNYWWWVQVCSQVLEERYCSVSLLLPSEWHFVSAARMNKWGNGMRCRQVHSQATLLSSVKCIIIRASLPFYSKRYPSLTRVALWHTHTGICQQWCSIGLTRSFLFFLIFTLINQESLFKNILYTLLGLLWRLVKYYISVNTHTKSPSACSRLICAHSTADLRSCLTPDDSRPKECPVTGKN